MTSASETGSSDHTGRGNDGPANDTGPDAHASVRESATSAYASTLESGAAALDTMREQAGAALEAVRDAAAGATERATKEIGANPLGALLGGLVIGAAAGALIPKSRAEIEALSGLALGERVSAAARAAADAARSTGKESLGDFVLNRETAMNDIVGKLIEAAFAVATSAGGAAAKAARDHK